MVKKQQSRCSRHLGCWGDLDPEGLGVRGPAARNPPVLLGLHHLVLILHMGPQPVACSSRSNRHNALWGGEAGGRWGQGGALEWQLLSKVWPQAACLACETLIHGLQLTMLHDHRELCSSSSSGRVCPAGQNCELNSQHTSASAKSLSPEKADERMGLVLGGARCTCCCTSQPQSCHADRQTDMLSA